MRTMKNNKGVAMVTVLIGVSFIIILASSLVYMSYMNYITKAVRNASTDNFYTDEFALDDLCMSLQQVVAGASSVDAAQNALRAATGAGPNPSGPGTVYNNAAVASLIQVASQEADVTVDTSVDTTVSANYIESATSVKLLGVEVTTTTEQGYQSTICTDIIISFPNGGLGDLDVNDFSVITDSPLVVNQGDVFFNGCVFISNPGGTALTVNQANVQILATRGIINGDLVISDNSYVAITGTVSVTGDIRIGSNSVLVCSDKLHYKGSLTLTSGGRVEGSPVHEPDMNTDAIDDQEIVDAGGLSKYLFREIWIRAQGQSDRPETQAWGSVTLQEYVDKYGWISSMQNNASGTRIGMGIGNQGTINGNDFYNSIIMSTASSVTVIGELRNSTVVCSGQIVFNGIAQPTYMQSMSDDIYEQAKSILISRFDGTFSCGVQNANGASGLWNDSMVDTADDTYDDGTGRIFVYRGGSMYVPCGYFLKDNTSGIITGVFSATQGDADPGNSTIMIQNWIKE